MEGSLEESLQLESQPFGDINRKDDDRRNNNNNSNNLENFVAPPADDSNMFSTSAFTDSIPSIAFISSDTCVPVETETLSGSWAEFKKLNFKIRTHDDNDDCNNLSDIVSPPEEEEDDVTTKIIGKDEVFSKPSHELLFGSIHASSQKRHSASNFSPPNFELESNYDCEESEDLLCFDEQELLLLQQQQQQQDSLPPQRREQATNEGEQSSVLTVNSSSSTVVKKNACLQDLEVIKEEERLTMKPPTRSPFKTKRKIQSRDFAQEVCKVPKYLVRPEIMTFEARGRSDDDEDDNQSCDDDDAGVNKLPEYLYSIAHQCLRTLLDSNDNQSNKRLDKIDLKRSPASEFGEKTSPKCNPHSRVDRNCALDKMAISLDDDENENEDEDGRCIVYVGKIRRFSTSKAKLRKRFEKFGAIRRITFHQRHRDLPLEDFAFVTFLDRSAASAAVERGNEALPSTAPRYDLGFGGRRRFCRQHYRDLDERMSEVGEEKCGGGEGEARGRVGVSYEELLQRNLARAKRKML